MHYIVCVEFHCVSQQFNRQIAITSLLLYQTKNSQSLISYTSKFRDLLFFKFDGKIVSIMAGSDRQTVNSIMREVRNNVITTKKNRKKGLWHEDCILPKRKMSETTFLEGLHTERCKKRCFCIQAIRREEENNVSVLIPM